MVPIITSSCLALHIYTNAIESAIAQEEREAEAPTEARYIDRHIYRTHKLWRSSSRSTRCNVHAPMSISNTDHSAHVRCNTK